MLQVEGRVDVVSNVYIRLQAKTDAERLQVKMEELKRQEDEFKKKEEELAKKERVSFATVNIVSLTLLVGKKCKTCWIV